MSQGDAKDNENLPPPPLGKGGLGGFPNESKKPVKFLLSSIFRLLTFYFFAFLYPLSHHPQNGGDKRRERG
jgi:hypothetical protein